VPPASHHVERGKVAADEGEFRHPPALELSAERREGFCAIAVVIVQIACPLELVPELRSSRLFEAREKGSRRAPELPCVSERDRGQFER
jgi:hypothetical protein